MDERFGSEVELKVVACFYCCVVETPFLSVESSIDLQEAECYRAGYGAFYDLAFSRKAK